MDPRIAKRFDELKEEAEQAAEANEAAAEKAAEAAEATKKQALVAKVMGAIEDKQTDSEVGATKAGVAKSSGSGRGERDHPFATSEDRAAAIAGYSAEDGDGSAAVAKARDTPDLGNNIERRVALLKGTAEPRAPQEQYLANLTGKKRERAISMIEKELPDEDGNAGLAKAMKDYSDERAEERREERDEWMREQHESITTPDWE